MAEVRSVTEVEARERAVRLPVDPVYGEDARDVGTLLLAEAMDVAEPDEVLIVGGGSGLTTAVAAHLASRGRVAVVCGNVAEAEQVEGVVGLNRLPNVEVLRAADLAPVRDRSFDVALLSVALVPSAPVLLRQLGQAATLLREGGRCYVAGGKHQGILSTADRLEAIFGNVQVVVYRKGHRVLLAHRAREVRAAWPDEPEQVERLVLRGRPYEIGLREGVFARGGLDEGTSLLIDALEVRPRDEVLDLGCGSGLVGLVAADLAREGRVYLVDSEVAAVELARANVARNAVGNAVVLASNGLAALGAATFDVIATNPPFHVGRVQTTEIARQFVEQSARHLREGGRFYAVANRFLKYEPIVEASFGSVRTVAENSRYKVLLGVRRRAAAPPATRPAKKARPGGRRAQRPSPE